VTGAGRLRAWLRGDDGVSAVEAAILAPALLAMLALAIVVMRTEVAKQAVDAAAHDAARAASLEDSGDAAKQAAQSVIHDRLDPEHLCRQPIGVDVNTKEFGAPIGQPAHVTVTITCVADFSDVAIPGMPGSTTITSAFTSDLDQFRGRSP
jgi:hypothetical protein